MLTRMASGTIIRMMGLLAFVPLVACGNAGAATA